MSNFKWLVLVPVILTLLIPNSTLAKERRIALIIGNGAYKDSPLRNPVNDSTDISAVLRELDFKVIERTDASLRQMKDAVHEFWVELTKGGVGLFYFAGHGLQVQGRNYLVPVDARVVVEQDVEFECLDAGRILGRMEAAGNDLNLVILDACRNNPFARSFRSGSRGLARMDVPTGSLVAFSTAPGTVAADGSGRNGVFTEALLKHIKTPGVSVNDLLMTVRKDVAELTDKKQVPWESSSLMGKFFFAAAGSTGTPEPLDTISSLEAERRKLEQERMELERLKTEMKERKRIEDENKLHAAVNPDIKEPREVVRDGHLIKQENGIIYDENTKLEWYVGPDENTTWTQADKWARRLTVPDDGWKIFGSRWRLPAYEELRSLFIIGEGGSNIVPLFQTSGSRFWTNEKKNFKRDSYYGTVDTSLARAYVFKGDYDFWESIIRPNGYRALAVRKRK